MDSIVEMQERRAARFEKAVLPHLDHIYCAALLLTRDLDDADDLVLGTFAHACESFHQVQRGTDVRAWLYRALSSTFTEASEWQQPAPLPMAADKPGYLQLADAERPIPFGMPRTDSEAC
jgi:RNA polymerase sigma-70 factor, ECF subfamily